MLGMFPNHGYPSSYGYRDPYEHGYGYPRRPAPAPSARERYLRALADEEAARRLYHNDYHRGHTYSNPYGDEEEYDDLPDPRARDYYRQQQLQQLAAQKEIERRRRAQLAYEAEQRAREEEEQAAYAAEMQRRKQIVEARRRAEAEKLQQPQKPKRYSQESYLDELARAMFGQPRRSTPSPEPAQKKREPSPPREPTPPTKAPTPTPAPTLTPEEKAKREEAASAIQTAFRSHRTRIQARKTLSTILSSLASLQSSFIFPASPDFQPSTSAPKPRLAYTSTNAPIHGYEDALIKLLSQLDAVESGGDVKVREERKSVARNIQKALNELDAMKDAAWKRLLEEKRKAEEQDAPTNIKVDNEEHEVDPPAYSEAMDVIEDPTSQSIPIPISVDATEATNTVPTNLTLDSPPSPTPEEKDISIEEAASIPLPPDSDIHLSTFEDQEEAMDMDIPVPEPAEAGVDEDTDSEESAVESIVHVSLPETPELPESPVQSEEQVREQVQEADDRVVEVKREEVDLKQKQTAEDFIMVAMENPFFSF